MHTHFRSERINQVLGKWWRKYVVDECPKSRRERLRRELIPGIKQDVTLQEAMRQWAIENQKVRVLEPEHG